MDTSTKTVTKEIKMYTFTEDELRKFKSEQREYGSRKTIEYIAFCYKNYIYEFNVGGAVELCKDILNFVHAETTYIPNTYKLNFNDWLQRNR